jgi:hypothetical protein
MRSTGSHKEHGMLCCCLMEREALMQNGNVSCFLATIGSLVYATRPRPHRSRKMLEFCAR